MSAQPRPLRLYVSPAELSRWAARPEAWERGEERDGRPFVGVGDPLPSGRAPLRFVGEADARERDRLNRRQAPRRRRYAMAGR